MSAALHWRTVTGSKSGAFLVKGTVLSVAFCGGNSRFAAYEVRTFDGVNHDREYIVRDADAVSDAEIRDGKRPPVVFRTADYDELLSFVSEEA